jgi:hypothetical protein
MPVPHPGTPISVPLVAHLVMWPALVVWIVFLARRQRTRSWASSPLLGAALVPACLFADAAALLAALRWPSTASNSFILAMLWPAMLFSVTTYMTLRTPRDDGGDGGNDESRDDPDPPWWPDFERQFRDYSRRGPRAPARPPKTPAGGSS